MSEQQVKSAKQTIEERFAAQRMNYSNEILTAVRMLEDVKTLVKAKVIFLSARQRLLEDHHVVIENYNKQAKKYRETKAQEIMNASNNMAVRLNEREKDKYVDGQPVISGIKAAMDLLQNQSNFLSESIKTIDQVLFSLKVRIDVEKMLNGD